LPDDLVKTELPSFDEIFTHPFVIESLRKNLGFEKPTPIQAAVAPAVLSGRNLFAGAKTGSGKTIAFLAPTAERLIKKEAKKALVLAPTRELVLQIDEEAGKLFQGQTDVVPVPLYGGVPVDPQILALKHHRPSYFIATPGRVLDLFQEGVLPLSEVEICVLDEADRMCDMGFAPQVTQILELLINCKQMLLFSATLPKELSDMMSRFCPDPVRIQVDAADKTSETIQHEAILCNRKDKPHRLLSLLEPQNVTALVFTRTRNGADALHRNLSRQLRNIGILHAGFSMGERERTIRAFREGDIRILIATDVVSRGIDVDRITHVIHFDIPDSLEDYIHRSGRSGRAGRSGHTIAFFEKDSRDQMERFRDLKTKVQFLPFKGDEKPEAPRPRAPQQRPPDEQRFQDEQRSRNEQRPRNGQRFRDEQRPRDDRGNRNNRRPRQPDQRHRPRVEKPIQEPASLISRTKSLLSRIFKRG
jgi:ATP-dependent RNA helicase RhlE